MANEKLEAVAQAAAITPEMPERVYPQANVAGEKTLLSARDVARDELLCEIPEKYVGEHAGVLLEEERVLTHFFKCEHPGYHGWYWGVTLARMPRSRKVTVSEVDMFPGEEAMLAPRWVPWDDRMKAIEKEKRIVKAREAEVEREERARRRAKREAEGEDGRGRRRTRRRISSADDASDGAANANRGADGSRASGSAADSTRAPKRKAAKSLERESRQSRASRLARTNVRRRGSYGRLYRHRIAGD